jgi:uncharacterized protein (TIGR02145 family)
MELRFWIEIDKSKKMKFKLFFLTILIITTSCSILKPSLSGTFTDKRDGKVYRWVKLKNQIWMAQNLDYQAEGAIYSTASTQQKTIGNLYFGSFIKNLSPEGWHIPTDDEWQELEKADGMSPEEASHYEYRGSVESDFLEGGSTRLNVLFTGVSNYHSTLGKDYEFVRYWSSTKVLKSYMIRSFRTDDNRIGKVMHGIFGYAYIRCVKNDTTTQGLKVDIQPIKKKK